MAFYGDMDGDESMSICVATAEGGETLCGGHAATHPLDRYGDSIWELVHNGRIHDSCDCRARLAERLGAQGWSELTEWAADIVEEEW